MNRLWILCLILSSCYISEELPPDQDAWEYDLPSNQQLNQEALLNLNTRVRTQEFGFIEGLTIIRNDHLVYENYYSPETGRNSPQNLGRAGLMITLAALGVAIDERAIAIEDSIYLFLPEYAGIFQEDPTKLGITVEDVLTHRTGLSWNENIERDPGDNDFFIMKQTSDWVGYLLSRTQVGVGFYSYNTANGILLAKMVENATGIDFGTYVKERLLDPMKVNLLEIEQDPNGNYNGGDGFNLTLVDFTKVAYLYLNEGFWQGRTLVNSNFAQSSFERQHQFSQSSVFNSIGYFWNFFGEGFQVSLGTDYESIVFFVDQRGQSIFIAPEEGMIVSVQSDILFGSGFELFTLFSQITQTIQ